MGDSHAPLSATIHAGTTGQEGLCIIRTVAWRIPAADGPAQNQLDLRYKYRYLN